MAGSFQWLTFLAARQQLAARLADPNTIFWTDAELKFYICQALRIFNSLTWTWRTQFAYSDPVNIWNSLGSLAGSPRLRTLTDSYCYSEMEYTLLEPSTAGVWTGTSQFNISDLSSALQSARDEMIQVSNCNQSLLTGIPLTPNTTVTSLADTIIDVERVRYMPVQDPYGGYGMGGYGQGPYGGGFIPGVTGFTLYRDDTVAQEFYESPLYQQSPGVPQTFSLSSEPPLSWVVDIPPAIPGTYEAVVLQSGTAFNPPTATLLGIPDDFAWVLECGALAELLGRDSEATDRERAAYCAKRYQDGLQLLLKTPWIQLGKVNGVAVSIDSIVDMDRYSAEWDSNPTGFGPVIVSGGIDFIGAPVGTGVGVTVLANAPVPVLDNDFIQCSRSNWDTVLDLAQARASFKMGGAEFKAALELETGAIKACAAENTRLRSLGAFSDVLDQRGSAQERGQNRYNGAGAKAAKG